MSSDEKTCPKCAESVKSAAAVCKHCGHDFAEPANATVEVASKKSISKSKGCLIILGAIVALGVIGSIAGGGGSNTEPAGAGPAEADATPALKVTAQQLEASYEANEVSAQQQYGGKRLEVSGIIKSIDLDFQDQPFVVLEGQNMFTGAQMKLTEESQKKASSLSKGQQITAICEDISEVVGTPMLKDCSII